MKRILVILLIIVLAASLMTGCSKKEEQVEFGWGTLDNEKNYTNEFFDFSIDLNSDMTFLSPQEILNENPPNDAYGEELEPIQISDIKDLSAESVVQFVYGSFYSEEESDKFNSYINIFSENMSSIGETMSKEDYVKNYMDFTEILYEDSMIEVKTYPLEKPWISDRQFAKGTLEIDYDQYTVFQEMYAITKNNYVLVIICVYSNDQEKAVFNGFIESIEID